MPFLSTIILTRDEELHLDRCIQSISNVSSRIYVVDCYSSDRTKQIATTHGTVFLQHPWVSHANQFNWALSQLDPRTEWILRIDADEYLTPELASEIQFFIRSCPPTVNGALLKRLMIFMDRKIRYGGMCPVTVLRLFRNGHGICENRLMDEHILCAGKHVVLNGYLVDHNLNSLSWWINKHNSYSSLEAAEILRTKSLSIPSSKPSSLHGTTARKRWIKDNIYSHIPLGLRSLLYFFYRYLFLLGFLDGKSGFAFHFLHAFWYRFLVDLKVRQVLDHSRSQRRTIPETASYFLNIDL